MRVVAVAVACVVALVAVCRDVAAERVSLAYERTRDAAACPNEAAMRDMVIARLGYDPFYPNESRIVRVWLDAASARIEVVAGGEVIGSRTLSAAAGCVELSEAVALALSIAIDPRAAFGGERPRPIAPLSRHRVVAGEPDVRPGFRDSVPREPRPVPVASRRSPREPVSVCVSAGVVAAFGAGPAAAAGATVAVRARRGGWSVALEGRLDRSTAAVFGPGRVRASLRFGALVPCVHRGAIAACGIVALGAVAGSGEDLDNPRESASLFAAGGARLAVDIGAVGSVRARLHADVLGAVSRGQLLVSDMEAWTQSVWSAAVGIGAVGRFP